MTYDIAIIGAGMAGASVAYFLPAGLRVVLLEMEAAPGYHTTGRSAAFYAETYGGPAVQPLTTASKAFFDRPPAGFSAHPLLSPRGALHLARAGAEAALGTLIDAFNGSGVAIEPVGPAAIAARVPLLRPEWRVAGLLEPGCADIDVAALHAGFLAGARARGAELRLDCGVHAVARDGGGWRLATAAGDIGAGVIVNAAGAWADAVAALAGVAPAGITPLRRTVVQIATDPAPAPGLPLTLDAAGSWYFKPEGARLWVSPHDELPDVARDTQPEEMDIAIAIDRFEAASTARVTRLERAWAGLRCFAPDRAPVLGFAPEAPGFFWCAGQGGSGIQTAPAAGMLCAALIAGAPLPEALERAGVDPGRYDPARFQMAGAGAA